MDLDPQHIINGLFTVIGLLGGWILNNFRRSLENLRNDDAELAKKVQAIEVLVAGDYVRKDDMERLTVRLFEKLDRIEDKMEKKVDK